MESIKDLFLLEPDVHFLNHGSFGACPREVFEVYQGWQRRLEEQPVRLLGREIYTLDAEARQSLAKYIHTDAENIVFIQNATYGVNIIARSLRFEAGDEVLSTDHEYGACDYTWEFNCAKSRAKYVKRRIPLPVPKQEDFVEIFWQGVTERTRVIFLSQITSPTGQIFPVGEICRRAREMGIVTMVDGAHAPGQIPLDLDAIGADFYTGNCHKWMMAPKGAGFLYARKEVQGQVEPLVVSWGYHATSQTTSGSAFIDHFVWTGTTDPSAMLSVPAAIRFMEEHDWETVREECHKLLAEALEEIPRISGEPTVYAQDGEGFAQMAIAELPKFTETMELKKRLYEEFRVEVPLTEWYGRKFVRVSVQGYNTRQDLEQLYNGLRTLLPQVQQVEAKSNGTTPF